MKSLGYECHITMRGDPAMIRPRVEALGWKFSAIDGDPVLGAGVLCYATKHYPSEGSLDVIVYVTMLTAQHLPNVIREKVELIVYDQRHEERPR